MINIDLLPGAGDNSEGHKRLLLDSSLDFSGRGHSQSPFIFVVMLTSYINCSRTGKGQIEASEGKTWTVGELRNWTAGYLVQKKVEYPRLDAEVLLAHALGCKRIDLYGMRFGDEATAEARQRYKE